MDLGIFSSNSSVGSDDDHFVVPMDVFGSGYWRSQEEVKGHEHFEELVEVRSNEYQKRDNPYIVINKAGVVGVRCLPESSLHGLNRYRR